MKQVSAAVPPRLLECVNKEFDWEFRRGFVFFSKGKDLNLEEKLSQCKVRVVYSLSVFII